MHRRVGRRDFLKGAGAIVALGAVDGCRLLPGASRVEGLTALQLAPLRVSVDRITRITVCTRPFRAQGPPRNHVALPAIEMPQGAPRSSAAGPPPMTLLVFDTRVYEFIQCRSSC